MRDIGIDRIMTTSPATVGPDDPIVTAKTLLESGDIHHLPVVEKNKLVGIISSSDLLKFELLGRDAAALSGATISQAMVADPVALESGANLRDAAKKLSVGGFHALPVVNTDRGLVGIVTSSDLIAHLLQQIPSGDGSIRQSSGAESSVEVDDHEIMVVLREAKEIAERDGRENKMANVLLHTRDRNRLLKEACKAAELYIRSGHGEHEHSVLVKRLAEL